MEEGIVFINTHNPVYAGFLEVLSGVPVINRSMLDCFDSLRKTRNVGEIPYLVCLSPNQEVRDMVREGWEKKPFRETTYD